MIRCYQLVDGKIVDTQDANAPIWVVINPDGTDMKRLVEECKIDEHNLYSALDADELARLEFEPDHMVMILKRPKNYSSKDHFLFKVSSIGVFLFKKRLIAVLSEDVPLFDSKLFAKISSLNDLALRMICRSIDHYREHLKVINMITDSLEQKINTSMENKYLLNLFTLEKSMVYYVDAINSNSILIEKIKTSAGRIGLTPENMDFLDDIIIETVQCAKQAEIYSNILAGLMDARASIVSNNINVLMKTLNIITIGIMVPTLVVSVFSMNVSFPLQNHPYMFWFVMLLAISSVIAFIVVWKRKIGHYKPPS